MDIHATDAADGRTALHVVSAMNNMDFVCLLLDHNATVSIQDHFAPKDDDQILVVCIMLKWMNTVNNKLIELSTFLDRQSPSSFAKAVIICILHQICVPSP